MNANRERIAKLQQEMKAEGMDMYLVPTADFHQSEYVGDYFKARAWLSGFTGSAGTLVVTQDQACLWTDGRYFIQAAKQLEDTGVSLMKMGEEGVPTVDAFIRENLPVLYNFAEKLAFSCEKKLISFAYFPYAEKIAVYIQGSAKFCTWQTENFSYVQFGYDFPEKGAFLAYQHRFLYIRAEKNCVCKIFYRK